MEDTDNLQPTTYDLLGHITVLHTQRTQTFVAGGEGVGSSSFSAAEDLSGFGGQWCTDWMQGVTPQSELVGTEHTSAHTSNAGPTPPSLPGPHRHATPLHATVLHCRQHLHRRVQHLSLPDSTPEGTQQHPSDLFIAATSIIYSTLAVFSLQVDLSPSALLFLKLHFTISRSTCICVVG